MAISDIPQTQPPAELHIEQSINSYYHLATTDPANDMRYQKRLYAVGTPGNNTLFVRVPVPKVDLSQQAETIWIISGITGILREEITDRTVVPEIKKAIIELLETGNVKFIFVANGTLEGNEQVEEWERDSETVRPLIEDAFGPYLKSGQVSMIGSMGGEKLVNGKVEYPNSYTPQQVFDACYIMLRALLKDSLLNVSDVSREILKKLDTVSSEGLTDAMTAHQKFKDIVLEIRKEIDSDFRLTNRGNDITAQGNKKYWSMGEAYHSVRGIISHPETGKSVFNLPSFERNIVYYSSVSGHIPTYYLKLSRLTKKNVAEEIVNKFDSQHLKGLTIAFGDVILDVPMYFAVHLAFHMGSVKVPMGLTCPVVMLNEKGEGHQFTKGTAEVLKMLVANRHKPINTWPYVIFPVPTKNEKMEWLPTSLEDLDQGNKK